MGAVGAVCSVQCAVCSAWAPTVSTVHTCTSSHCRLHLGNWAPGHLGTWADRWTCDVTLSIRALGALGGRGADVDYLAIPTHLLGHPCSCLPLLLCSSPTKVLVYPLYLHQPRSIAFPVLPLHIAPPSQPRKASPRPSNSSTCHIQA